MNILQISIPQWLNESDFTKREKKKYHRMHMILRIFALKGPIDSIYKLNLELEKHLKDINYPSSLRYVNELSDKVLIKNIGIGKRDSKKYDVTRKGLFFSWFQHYLSSEEFLKCIYERSEVLNKLPRVNIFKIFPKFDSFYERMWIIAPIQWWNTLRRETQTIDEIFKFSLKEDAEYLKAWETYSNAVYEVYETVIVLRVLEHFLIKEDISNVLHIIGKEDLEYLRKKITDMLRKSEAMVKNAKETNNMFNKIAGTILKFIEKI